MARTYKEILSAYKNDPGSLKPSEVRFLRDEARAKKKPEEEKKGSLATLAELARALGREPGQLRRESFKPGFPSHQIDGKTRYDVQAVRTWREEHIHQRGSYASGNGKKAGVALASDTDDFIVDMMGGKATALTITRAAMQMASRRVARAAVAGTMSANDLDGLKKTLAELRAAESGYVELEREKRGLIPRSELLEIISSFAARIVRVCGILENTIGLQVCAWTGDPAFLALPADQRARLAREWASKQCADVRNAEADEVEKLGKQPQ